MTNFRFQLKSLAECDQLVSKINICNLNCKYGRIRRKRI